MGGLLSEKDKEDPATELPLPLKPNEQDAKMKLLPATLIQIELHLFFSQPILSLSFPKTFKLL